MACGEPMPTANHSKFLRKNFFDSMSNHKIHKKFAPQKFATMIYGKFHQHKLAVLTVHRFRCR